MVKQAKTPSPQKERVRFLIVKREVKKLFNRLHETQGWSKEFIWHRYSDDPWDINPIQPRLYINPHLVRAWSEGTTRPTDDEAIVRLAIDGVRLGKLDSQWLKNFLTAVDARKDLCVRIYEELEREQTFDADSFVVTSRAMGVRIRDSADAKHAIENLEIQTNRKTLVLIGGASFMEDNAMQKLRSLFNKELVGLCQELDLTVVDGATQAGIVQLIGQARADAGASFPLVGVAPFYHMRMPQNLHHGSELPEPSHTHFVFTAGTEWEDASPVLSSIARTIAGTQPSVALLINGGSVTYFDALCSLWDGRPVVALEDTGRTADYFARAIKGRDEVHPSVQQLLNTHLFHTAHLGDPKQLVALLKQLLEE